MPRMRNAVLEEKQIIFRNFSGKEDQYNRAGDRNFAVVLDAEEAQRMLEEGWNVKTLGAREEGDEDRHYIQVSVSYKTRPPKIRMVTSRGQSFLGEGEVELLDWVDVQYADVVLNPYEWVVNGKSGVKAYLQNLVVVIEEDPIDLKWAAIADEQKALGKGSQLELESGEEPYDDGPIRVQSTRE